MHDGFDRYGAAQIRQALVESQEQLRLVKLAANRDGRAMPRRRAKKLLTDLCKELARRLKTKATDGEPRPERGVRFYDQSLKRKYYPRRISYGGDDELI
jgi:hypothetical protein